jgi:hypothetical protein
MSAAEENKDERPVIPVARIVTDKVREKTVTLEYPVEFDGKLYTEIRVHRVTVKDVDAYFDRIKGEGSGFVPPMVDCPQEVWDVMDADDQQAVDEAALPFWPRRLKAAFGSILDPGETTSD